MDWKLKGIKKETNHKFLNFYTVTYTITKDNKEHEYPYFMASRKDTDKLLCKTKDYSRADGVLIPCYYIDPTTKEVSLLITKQFRPPMGRYVNSFPAGLMDPSDKDEFETARREAKEEAGVIISDLELLAPASPTSSGLSDEINAVVLGRIEKFETTSLEEYEDIQTKLIPILEVEKLLNNPSYFFPLQIRMVIKYLLERYKRGNLK